MSEIEVWRPIFEFPDYDVSNYGRIYNHKAEQLMSVSYTGYGHAKISLTDFSDGTRHTRSVALIVAETFLDPPNSLCNAVIMLDGDLTNLRASNLAWRPKAFAWKYTHQFKEHIPVYLTNLPVYNRIDDIEYDSIVQAGMTEGLLLMDVWRSTYTGAPVFPTGSIFEVVERV
jgi:hypothetical protein